MDKIVRLTANAPIIPQINTVFSPPIMSANYPAEFLINTPTININDINYKLDAIIEEIKPSTITYSTYLSGLTEIPTLPNTLDLRDKLGPIRDQGAIGSCVAYSISSVKEWQTSNDNEYNGYLSPAFIYVQRVNAGQAGMFLSNACDIMAAKGICKDATLPYSVLGTDDTTANKINSSILSIVQYNEANKYRISNSVLVRSVNDLKTALYLNGPCIFCVAVYGTSSRQMKYTRMWAPENTYNTVLGYHCMSFVGYNSNGFIIRNSWSIYWNPQNSIDMAGYDYMSFADFPQYVLECWSSTDLYQPPPTPPPTPPSKPPTPPTPPSKPPTPPSKPPTPPSKPPTPPPEPPTPEPPTPEPPTPEPPTPPSEPIISNNVSPEIIIGCIVGGFILLFMFGKK